MSIIMINGIDRGLPAAVVAQRLARVRVHVEAGEVAAGNVDSDAVPLLKHIRGGIELDREGIHAAGLHEFFLLK